MSFFFDFFVLFRCCEGLCLQDSLLELSVFVDTVDDDGLVAVGVDFEVEASVVLQVGRDDKEW